MTMQLVFFVEEESMRAALEGIVPRALPGALAPIYVTHQGKQDLEKSIARKLRAWRSPARFVIIRDQDSGECRAVKERLTGLCRDTPHDDALIRVACRELESWFLGDLRAVERAFATRGLAKQQETEKFRDPDRLSTPSRELQRLVPGYRKVEGARLVAEHLDLENNRSRSFCSLIRGLRRIAMQSG
jgi:Domain of unknown function (DUF4276)